MRIRSVLLSVLALGALALPAPAASAAPAVDRIHLALGSGGSLSAGMGAMWVARTDEYHDVIVWRIDPGTDAVTRIVELKFAGERMTTGYGSLWITDYFGNAVWRVSPRGVVLARIPTGLQPDAAYPAFGSIWVGNHHGHSATRIDAATNAVLGTDTIGDPDSFRDGPQSFTSDAAHLYAGSSDVTVVQSIDPRTDAVVTPPGTSADNFCGRLTYAAGSVWSVDRCSDTLYRHALDSTVISSVTYGPMTGADVPSITDATLFAGHLWVAVDRDFDQDTGAPLGGGVLEERDPRTGALLRTLRVGGDAGQVTGGFGSLWTYDTVHSVVRRVTP